MQQAKGVEAVERAFQILDCFGVDSPALSLAELAKRTDLYKSTILRLAVSLERFGYLVREESGRFRLGPNVWRLGAAYRQSFDLARIMRPELKVLSAATNETASYYIREGNSRICLFRSEPGRAIRHSITEGASMPLERGASGKILLAFSGKENEGDPGIRAAGYAMSIGERDPEVAAVSLPIVARSGELLGAVAVSGLINRFSQKAIEQTLAALRASKQRLEASITI